MSQQNASSLIIVKTLSTKNCLSLEWKADGEMEGEVTT